MVLVDFQDWTGLGPAPRRTRGLCGHPVFGILPGGQLGFKHNRFSMFSDGYIPHRTRELSGKNVFGGLSGVLVLTGTSAATGGSWSRWCWSIFRGWVRVRICRLWYSARFCFGGLVRQQRWPSLTVIAKRGKGQF